MKTVARIGAAIISLAHYVYLKLTADTTIVTADSTLYTADNHKV